MTGTFTEKRVVIVNDKIFGVYDSDREAMRKTVKTPHRDSFMLKFIPLLIGRHGPYPGACSGKFTTTEYIVKQSPEQGIDHASIINFLSNEDTGKQACFELAPGYLHTVESGGNLTAFFLMRLRLSGR
jgi:hypothetical protein